MRTLIESVEVEGNLRAGGTGALRIVLVTGGEPGLRQLTEIRARINTPSAQHLADALREAASRIDQVTRPLEDPAP